VETNHEHRIALSKSSKGIKNISKVLSFRAQKKWEWCMEEFRETLTKIRNPVQAEVK